MWSPPPYITRSHLLDRASVIALASMPRSCRCWPQPSRTGSSTRCCSRWPAYRRSHALPPLRVPAACDRTQSEECLVDRKPWTLGDPSLQLIDVFNTKDCPSGRTYLPEYEWLNKACADSFCHGNFNPPVQSPPVRSGIV